MKKLSLIGLLLILGAILPLWGAEGYNVNKPDLPTISTATTPVLEPVAVVSVIGPHPTLLIPAGQILK